MATKINGAATILMFGAILVAALLSRVAASPCDDEISRLTACYSYIEASSSPASDCCSRLDEVATAKPECLCRVLHSDNHLNKTRIMGLPKACNVTTPPASLCNSSILQSSGYLTKICNSRQLSLMAVSYASILILI